MKDGNDKRESVGERLRSVDPKVSAQEIAEWEWFFSLVRSMTTTNDDDEDHDSSEPGSVRDDGMVSLGTARQNIISPADVRGLLHRGYRFKMVMVIVP